MARTTWQIYKKITGVWTLEGSGLYRPNDDLNIQKTSTQQKVVLANGSNAYVTPTTKYLDQILRFIWYWDDGTIKAQVEGYINNQNDLKIIDHDSNVYVGRFISINSVQFIGEDPDKYDITAEFEIMPTLL